MPRGYPQAGGITQDGVGQPLFDGAMTTTASTSRRTLRVRTWARPLHGVVTRELLLAAGRPRRDIDLAIKHGDLTALYPGVYVVRGAEITWHTRVLAALRYLDRQSRRRWDGTDPGPLIAVTGVAAGVLLGFAHLETPGDAVFAANPRCRSRQALILARPELTPADVHDIDGVLTTSTAWTVAELCAVLRLSHLHNIVADLVRAGKLDLSLLEAVGNRVASLNHDVQVLLSSLTEPVLLARSERERLVFRRLETLGIVLPRVNDVLSTAIGMVEVDLHWPHLKIIVEIDGPHHDEPDQRAWDDRRDAALRLAGWRVERISTEDLDADPAAVIRRIADLVAPA